MLGIALFCLQLTAGSSDLREGAQSHCASMPRSTIQTPALSAPLQAARGQTCSVVGFLCLEDGGEEGEANDGREWKHPLRASRSVVQRECEYGTTSGEGLIRGKWRDEEGREASVKPEDNT